VTYLADADVYAVTTYDAVAAALREPVALSSTEGMAILMGAGAGGTPGGALGLDLRALRLLIASDPPEHTRLRRLLGRVFTPKAISRLEPRLRRQCRDLVSTVIDKGDTADLIVDLAEPFPVTVIAELLGIPTGDRDDFRRWSNALVGLLAAGIETPEAMQAVMEMVAYTAEVVNQRFAHPSEDLIGRLVASSLDDRGDDEHEPLNAMEIVLFAVLLLVAGNETTTSLVGNGYAALLDHPSQAAHLRADHTLLPAAIEEALRYDCPAQVQFRGATADTAIAGTTIPAGATVMVSFAAANHDPAHYDNPHEYRIERNPGDHLGFGHGIHYCLGATLARLETRIIAETLLDAARTIKPTGPATRRPSGLIIHGFSNAPIHAEPL
jgi:cytochrome P450